MPRLVHFILFLLLQVTASVAFADSSLNCGNDGCPKRRSCQAMLVLAESLTPRQVTQFRSLEEQATDIVRKVMISDLEAKAEVNQWTLRLEQRVNSGNALSLMEHMALSYILKKEFLARISEPEVSSRVLSLIEKSWLNLVGAPAPSKEQLMSRLPRKILAKASPREKLFHSALFSETFDSENEVFSALKKRLVLFKDYIPSASDKVMLVGLLAFSFSETGGQVLAGALMGYLIATLAEHSIHKYVGHATSRLLELKNSKRWAWIGRALSHNWFSHSPVHHGLAGKSYDRTQLPEEEFEKMLDRVRAKEPEAIAMIQRGDFGVTLKTPGIIAGMALVAPVYLATMWALNLGPEATVGLLAPSWLHVAASKYLHPYLHQSREEVLKNASKPMRWFLTSRYGEMILRHHYVHHKSAKVNFNLVFGADWILGTLRNPSLEQIFQMADYNLIGATWED